MTASRRWPLLGFLMSVALLSGCRPDVQERPLTLARVFSDGAVLQRDVPARLWGWGTPGDAISVQVSTAREGEGGSAVSDVQTVVTTDASWEVDLAPQGAGGPFTVEVRSARGDTVRLGDVWFGDVWLASGQSNMEWRVMDADGAEETARLATDTLIREIKVPRDWSFAPRSDISGGQWRVASAETVPHFSAVAYHAARTLRAYDPTVPIGIIHSSWGGSRIEPWMSAQTLGLSADDAERIYRSIATRDDSLLQEAESNVEAVREQLFAEKNQQPTLLYHAMIAPLERYALRGFWWYQGESNAGAQDAEAYEAQFQAMITQWRQAFGVPEAPFIWAQLASYKRAQERPDETGWATLRAAQSAALALPNTGEAILLDIGDADDIHPRNKHDVGARIARWAIRLGGDTTIVAAGPRLSGAHLRPSGIELSFEDVGGGLSTGTDGAVGGLALERMDRTWSFVRGQISADRARVVVPIPNVATARRLRYAWADNPVLANLSNVEGLPASPFELDVSALE